MLCKAETGTCQDNTKDRPETGHTRDIPDPQDLAKLIEIWPKLSETVRYGVLNIVETSHDLAQKGRAR
jgi:hypothetical protein